MQRYKALGFVLLLGFLYGSTLVVSRFSVGQYAPLTYISLRLALATCGYVFLFALNKEKRWPTDWRLWVKASILGLIGTAIPMVGMVSSLQYLSSGVASLLITLAPGVTVILAQFFLADEQLTFLKASGVLIAFMGAGFLLLRGESGLAEFASADWRGYAWNSLGLLFGGGSVVYSRRFLRHEDMWDVSSVRMLSAAVAVIVATTFTVGFDMQKVTAVGYGALVYAAIAGTFCGMWLNFYIVKNFGATSATQVSYVLPVISTILGAVVLGERITSAMLVGMTIIFAGLTLLNWRGAGAVVSKKVSAVRG